MIVATLGWSTGSGLWWAFVAGLTSNVLLPEPLGIVPLGMIVVSAGTALAARAIGSRGWRLAALAGLLGSLVVDLIDLVVSAAGWAGGSGRVGPAAFIGPALQAGVLNAALAAAIGVLALAWRRRRGERPQEW